MSTKLVAFTVVKNVTKLGYPWVESIHAVLPFVDEFWIEEGYGDDNTFYYMQKLAFKFPGKVHISRYQWKQMNTGFAIGDATQHVMDRLNQTDADWLLCVQADELWHPLGLTELYDTIQYANSPDHEGDIDAIMVYFLHLAKNFQELQFPPGKESYQAAIRCIRNYPDIKSHRDAWTFDGYSRAVLMRPEHPVVHANSTYWKYWAAKARSHAEELYPDLKFYMASAEEREREMEQGIPEIWTRTESPFSEHLPRVILPTIGWTEYHVREELVE